MRSSSLPSSSSSVVARLGFLSWLALILGCGHADGGNGRVTEQASIGPDEPRDAGPSVVDAAPATSPRIAQVRANGTGCPNQGTWESSIAPDGSSATLSLRAFDVAVSQGEGLSVEDCTYAVKVEGAAGYAFTLDRFEETGFASLQGTGVNADESLKYYFQGNPVASESRSRQLTSGAPAASYSFESAFGGDTAVWSPCGGGRELNVTSRLVLRNNPEKTGYGYVTPSTVKLRLAWRRC